MLQTVTQFPFLLLSAIYWQRPLHVVIFFVQHRGNFQVMTFPGLIHGQSENSNTTNFESLINSHSTAAKHDPRSSRNICQWLIWLSCSPDCFTFLQLLWHLDTWTLSSTLIFTIFNSFCPCEVLLKPWGHSIKEMLPKKNKINKIKSFS